MREQGLSWVDIVGEFACAFMIVIGMPVGLMFLGEIMGY
jgi:hypothetical protein